MRRNRIAPNFIDNKAGKPIGIQRHIGRCASLPQETPTAISKCSNEPPETPEVFRTKNQANLQRMGSEF